MHSTEAEAFSTMSVPVIVVDNSSISEFFATPGNTADQTYSIACSGFAAGETITVTVTDASGSFTISDNGADFYTSISLTVGADGSLDQMFMVRFAPSDTDPHTATIDHFGPGATTQTLTVNGNPDPLPVNIISVNAKNVNNSIELNWTTGSDMKESHFDVEVMKNFKTGFKKIGSINANIGNNSHAYSFKHHPQDLHGIYYFRVKQVNTNGSYSYSRIIFLETQTDQKAIVGVGPNPVASSSQLSIVAKQSGLLNIFIVNINGTEVYKTSYSVEKGTNSIILPINQLTTTGVYTLVTELNGDRNWIKLIKAK